ncbi:hypothetical protein ABTY53_19480 [Streptomyces noursei]|uniref:hypothetical protein n=1 Tax=Streptomyces noursei TaxID=1971 RepID=UPI00332BF94B
MRSPASRWFRRIRPRRAARLPERAGQDSAAANLGTVAGTLLDSAGPVIAGLALPRPAAAQRLRTALRDGAPGFDAVQDAITDCLAALDSAWGGSRPAPTAVRSRSPSSAPSTTC